MEQVDSYVDLATVCVAAVALAISILSLHASLQANRAAIFDRRYEIYDDAEKFLSAWMRDGRPEMAELGRLVGAWSRSHFLCGQRVTQYLRTLWVDALDADYLNKVMSGDAEGDHAEAVQKFHAIQKKHFDYEKLREVFMRDLKVSSSIIRKTPR